MAILCPHCDTWTILLETGHCLACGRDPEMNPIEYKRIKQVKDEIDGNPKTYGGDSIYLLMRRIERGR